MSDPAEDDDEFIIVPTEDEAIAMALAMCPDGEAITLHTAECAIRPDRPEDCSCSPMTLRKGASA